MIGIARVRTAEGERFALYDPGADTGAERVAMLDPQPVDWPAALAQLHGLADAARAANWLSADVVEFLPPAGPGTRVICVARNYADHAREQGTAEAPSAPVLFLKPLSALVGHRQPTVLPAVTSFLDWEAELAVVVGAHLLEASADEARAAIAGFTIANDGSARDLQPIDFGGREIVDWFSAKSLDRSSALGPAVFPAARVSRSEDLRITLRRNGEVMQDDRAGSMLHRPEELLARASHILELHPGDVLLTGTPAGVGKARGMSLADGDELEITVEPLAALRTRITARPRRGDG